MTVSTRLAVTVMCCAGPSEVPWWSQRQCHTLHSWFQCT